MKPSRLLALFPIAGMSRTAVASEAILSAAGYGDIRFVAKPAEVEANSRARLAASRLSGRDCSAVASRVQDI